MCIPDLSGYAEPDKADTLHWKDRSVFLLEKCLGFLFVSISVPRGNFRKPVKGNECCDKETMHAALSMLPL